MDTDIRDIPILYSYEAQRLGIEKVHGELHAPCIVDHKRKDAYFYRPFPQCLWIFTHTKFGQLLFLYTEATNQCWINIVHATASLPNHNIAPTCAALDLIAHFIQSFAGRLSSKLRTIEVKGDNSRLNSAVIRAAETLSGRRYAIVPPSVYAVRRPRGGIHLYQTPS